MNTRAWLVEILLLVGMGSVGLFEGLRLTRRVLDKHEPIGPGGYVIFVAGILLVCGLIYGIKGFLRLAAEKRSGRNEKASVEGYSAMPLRRAIIPVAVFIAYVAALPILGYLASTACFFWLSMWTFGERSWIKCTLISIVLTAAFYVGFGIVAEVMLP